MVEQVERFEGANMEVNGNHQWRYVYMVLLIIAMLLLVACASKKTAIVEDVATHTEQVDTTAVVAVHTAVIDTAWWNSGTYTHTIITFEPDTMPAQSVSECNVVNIGGVNVATHHPTRINRIESTIINRNTGGRVNVERRDSTSEIHASNGMANMTKNKQVVKTPVHVVRPWVVVALLILAILLAVLYKRFGVFAFIRRVIGRVRNFI